MITARALVSSCLVSSGLVFAACGDDTGRQDEGGSGTDSSGGSSEGSTSDASTSIGPDGSSSDSTDTSTSTSSADDSTTADSSDGDPNQPPVAEDDDLLTSTAVLPLQLAAPGVLANDIDPDGDAITVTDFDASSAAGAMVTLQDDGALTLAPVDPFWGPDAFGYEIGDGQGGSDTASVAVMVAPALERFADLASGMRGLALDGAAGGERAGYAVAGPADIDGDGLGDLVVGADRSDVGATDAGRVYVVFGSAWQSAPLSLEAVAAGDGGFVIEGVDASSVAGRSVAIAGDTNGDGLADVVVGAPGAADGAGRACVVFGKADSTPVTFTDVLAGEGGFAMTGTTAADAVGSAVAGAGDVDGDGLSDVVLGAPGANGGIGRAYVVFGREDTDAIALADVAAGQGGFAIAGEGGNDGAGTSVGGGGDVNGDGLADVLVGSPRADPVGGSSGRSYVVFGKANGTAVALGQIAAGSGGFAIDGVEANDLSGTAVADAGDVNGDGRADVIVGAYGAEGEINLQGRAYVVFGKASGAAVELVDVEAGIGGFTLDGEAEGDFAGWSVAGVGDIDGDGLDDIAVGAQGADFAGGTAGRLYLVYGRSSTELVSLAEVAAGSQGFAFDGEDSLDLASWSVAGGGDIDGDGLSDVVSGAYGFDGVGQDSGRAYVLLGGDYRRQVTRMGTSADDLLEGTGERDVLVGGPGQDELRSGGGEDVLLGGPGDDVIALPEPSLFRIDGGPGNDVLRIDGAGIQFDLTNYYDAAWGGLESIDLTGDGDNTLFIEPRQLRALSDTSNTLTVLGDAGDAVVADLSEGSFASLPSPPAGFVGFSNGVLTLLIAESIEAFVQL